MLACGSSDGSFSILKIDKQKWVSEIVRVEEAGVSCGGINAVCWAPYLLGDAMVRGPSSNASADLSVPRLAVGCCDGAIRVYEHKNNQWTATVVGKHGDWVRDVAWAPSIGVPKTMIASCSQDGTVAVWTSENGSGEWKKKELRKFEEGVWKVSWSECGNILAVASGDNKVTLWKDDGSDNWVCVNTLDEPADPNAADVIQSLSPNN